MKHCQRDENCILTLSQIKQELRQRLPNNPEIHNCTVSRTLQGMLTVSSETSETFTS